MAKSGVDGWDYGRKQKLKVTCTIENCDSVLGKRVPWEVTKQREEKQVRLTDITFCFQLQVQCKADLIHLSCQQYSFGTSQMKLINLEGNMYDFMITQC